MEIVKISKDFFDICNRYGADPRNQLLRSDNGRPCVILLKLSYRKMKYDFILPIKSNISSDTDNRSYFALPPNNRTKDGFFHGLSYIKMFPITKKYVMPYYYKNNPYFSMVKQIIDNHEKEIISAGQRYLNQYENGNGNLYTPEIDLIIDMLEKERRIH